MLVGIIVSWSDLGKNARFGLLPAVNNDIVATFSMVALCFSVKAVTK